MERPSTASTNLARAVLAAAFAIVVWRAAVLPVTAAEAALWDRVVRQPAASLLVTPGDWSAFVYGLLAKRCAGLFRLSEFSLRLPAIFGGLLYGWALYHLCLRRPWLLLPLAAVPILWNWFNLAGGPGLALGLTAMALAHPAAAGVWLGLALAACPQIGFVPATAALGLVALLGVWKAVEKVVVPAIALGFVLLIVPLSHAGAALEAPTVPNDRDAALRSAIATLEVEAGKGTARISASPSAASLAAFYRSRDRLRGWAIGEQQPEFFLWIAPDPPPAGHRGILYQRAGVVLAR